MSFTFLHCVIELGKGKGTGNVPERLASSSYKPCHACNVLVTPVCDSNSSSRHWRLCFLYDLLPLCQFCCMASRSKSAMSDMVESGVKFGYLSKKVVSDDILLCLIVWDTLVKTR